MNTNSDQFDPVFFLSRNLIECRKLHYSVPLFLNDINALIRFDNEKNQLKIFNVTEILSKEREQDNKKNEVKLNAKLKGNYHLLK